MQFDPCLICGRPALERYPLVSLDLATMIEQRLSEPLCEPHRRWLAEAEDRGRGVAGARLRLTATP